MNAAKPSAPPEQTSNSSDCDAGGCPRAREETPPSPVTTSYFTTPVVDHPRHPAHRLVSSSSFCDRGHQDMWLPPERGTRENALAAKGCGAGAGEEGRRREGKHPRPARRVSTRVALNFVIPASARVLGHPRPADPRSPDPPNPTPALDTRRRPLTTARSAIRRRETRTAHRRPRQSRPPSAPAAPPPPPTRPFPQRLASTVRKPLSRSLARPLRPSRRRSSPRAPRRQGSPPRRPAQPAGWKRPPRGVRLQLPPSVASPRLSDRRGASRSRGKAGSARPIGVAYGRRRVQSAPPACQAPPLTPAQVPPEAGTKGAEVGKAQSLR
ncbi:serine/arginine repetitive matrix protein 1-like [Balaenoptera musculus]|uniref:Serine/arginine repetitive matrix protein 1-like n=1 Tax=Balaenoptera musculus TaxID=9771 RepID=A0A8B8V884_BALMU|nr:serine/arginine repetitive matrix protein 1-like [Balaenoptera musculus]